VTSRGGLSPLTQGKRKADTGKRGHQQPRPPGGQQRPSFSARLSDDDRLERPGRLRGRQRWGYGDRRRWRRQGNRRFSSRRSNGLRRRRTLRLGRSLRPGPALGRRRSGSPGRSGRFGACSGGWVSRKRRRGFGRGRGAGPGTRKREVSQLFGPDRPFPRRGSRRHDIGRRIAVLGRRSERHAEQQAEPQAGRNDGLDPRHDVGR
jgi:hypothetical protein